MKDYTIAIKKNNEIICTVGGNNMDYDNVIWWQLSKLLEIVEKGFNSKDELASVIESETEYFELTDDANESAILDLDNKTISLPTFPLFNLEEVCPEECCISLKIKDDQYYAVYEDGQEYLMENVEFDDVKLLKKENVSLEEFKKISNFVDKLIINGETDYLLNHKHVIRFNCI